MLKSTFKYVFSVIGAAYFGLLVMVLATTPVRAMVDYKAEYVITAVICVLASMVMLFLATMKVGYDENTPDRAVLNGRTVLQMVVAVAFYVVVTVIFRYYTGAASNVAWVTIVMRNLRYGTDIKVLAKEYGGTMFLSLVMQTIPFIPAMVAGYVVGGKRRAKSRAALHGGMGR